MSYKIENIKQNIKLHTIKTDKFKTNLFAIFLSTPLKRETVTKNALIPAVLRRGTKNLVSQEEISKKLEEMYGATFDCGLEKTGDNQILKFYLETVNDEFLPNKANTLQNGINVLFDIVLNPLTENNVFKKEYVETEKENIRKIIESKKDNKDRYAFERCVEEMYKDKVYGLYKYGYIEDLEKINEINLYEDYLELINCAKIDIFASGDIDKKDILEIAKNNSSIKNLKDRIDICVIDNVNSFKCKEEKTVEEKLNVTQGKLVIGTNVNFNEENAKYKISLYNVILGEGASSKMFQNVREKESLAYTARSNYIRQKSNIYIRCGIEIKNYEKAVEVIKKQLEDMKNGKFSEEDIKNAKEYVIASLRNIKEEQDSEISYWFGQELSGEHTSLKEYEEKINRVTKEDILKVANSITIDTIYFLRN